MPPASRSTACVFCAKKRKKLEIYLYSSEDSSDEDCIILRQTLRFLSIGLGVEFHSLDESSSSLSVTFQFCPECEKLLLEAQRLMSAFQELSHKIKTLVQDSMKMDKAQQNLFGGNQQNTETCRRFRQELCAATVHVEVEVKEEFEWEIEPDGDELSQENDFPIQGDITGKVEYQLGDEDDEMVCQEDEDENDINYSTENYMTIDTEATAKVEEASDGDEDDYTEDTDWRPELDVDTSNAIANELDQSYTEPEPGPNCPNIARRLRSRSRTNRSSDQSPSIYVYPSRNPKKQKTPKISDWKSVLCPICDENLDSSTQYAAHLKSHILSQSNVRNLKCHFCSITKTSNTSAVRIRIHELQEHGDSLPFSCGICDKKYFKSNHLEAHSIIHTVTQGPFKCSICQDQDQNQKEKLEFLSKEKLEEHIILVHNHEKISYKPLTCEICKKVFRRTKKLAEHMARHKNEKQYACEICHKKINIYRALIRHLLQKHENQDEDSPAATTEKLFHCEKPNCGKKFRTMTLFEWHEGIHERYDLRRDELKFNCEICSIPFQAEEKLESHNKHWHSKIIHKWLTCPLKSCQLNFRSVLKGPVMEHVRTAHPELMKFPCKTCDKAYYTDEMLKTHVKTHPDFLAPKGIFGCDVCAAKFTEREKLAAHLEIHTGEGHRKCRHCPMTFKTSMKLSAHIQLRHSDKPFKCDVNRCKYSYTLEKYLILHKEKFHPAPDAIKTFLCDLCSKFFSTELALKRHKTHHNTSDCEICGKTVNSSKMDQHVRTVHLKNIEKKNKCYFCGQMFLSRENMKSHIYTHTKERPFSCSKCGKDFNQRHCLKNHACDTQRQRPVVARNRRRDTDTKKSAKVPAQASFSRSLAAAGSATFGLTHEILGIAGQSNPSMANFSFAFPQAQQLMDFQQMQAQNQLHMQVSSSSEDASSLNVNGPFPLGNYCNNDNFNVSSATKLNNQGQGQFNQEQTGQRQPVLEYNFYQ